MYGDKEPSYWIYGLDLKYPPNLMPRGWGFWKAVGSQAQERDTHGWIYPSTMSWGLGAVRSWGLVRRGGSLEAWAGRKYLPPWLLPSPSAPWLCPDPSHQVKTETSEMSAQINLDSLNCRCQKWGVMMTEVTKTLGFSQVFWLSTKVEIFLTLSLWNCTAGRNLLHFIFYTWWGLNFIRFEPNKSKQKNLI